MKIRYGFFVLALTAGAGDLAADKPSVEKLDRDKAATSPANDVSPLEKHPECMDRTAGAQSSNCTIQDSGTPRHKYPPAATPKSTVVKPSGTSQ
jgi:hypothetical protein